MSKKSLANLLILTSLFLVVGCAATKEPVKPDKTRIEQAPFQNSIRANFPTDLAFKGDELFFTEKVGTLKVLKKGSNDAKTVKDFHVPDRVQYNEIGLLGIALSPDFENDHLIYLYHTHEKDSDLFNKVIRIDTNEPKKKPVTILEGIKGNDIHDGGKLAFGPDGDLYIATGDAGQEELAQNKDSLNGKVLRVKPDGSIPADNPFNNAVWSYGHRNIFGMTFDNKGNLFVTENGPNENDEINKIVKGGNYGWSLVTGNKNGHFIEPLITYKTSIAPTGIIFYTGMRYKKLTNKLIFGDYINGDVHQLTLDGNKATDKIIANSQGSINATSQTADGFIYIATENQIKRLNL